MGNPAMGSPIHCLKGFSASRSAGKADLLDQLFALLIVYINEGSKNAFIVFVLNRDKKSDPYA